MSEEERKDVEDEGQEDDVEAHKKHGGKMTDDGDDADDVEAHRKHGGK